MGPSAVSPGPPLLSYLLENLDIRRVIVSARAPIYRNAGVHTHARQETHVPLALRSRRIFFGDSFLVFWLEGLRYGLRHQIVWTQSNRRPSCFLSCTLSVHERTQLDHTFSVLCPRTSGHARESPGVTGARKELRIYRV